MTSKEWKRVARILKESYKGIEAEAISKGIDIFSDEYKELIDVVREKVLTKLGFTLEEYREKKDELEAIRLSNLYENVKTKIGKLSDTHIPTMEDIEEIAHKVAQEYIKPPQITNEIVKETTHEVKIEQPKIIETVRVENRVEKYDDKKLLKELAKLESKIAEIVIPDEEKIRNDLKFELQKNIDTLGMPDFRKLGMGLQAQIDEVRNSTPTGGGHTIQDEGVTLTQRTKLNFVGAGVTATDDAGNDATIVTIPTTDLSGYVPYTGATGDVDLGNNDLIIGSDFFKTDYSNKQIQIGEDNLWTGDSLTPLNIITNVDNFTQIYFQNKNNGTTASADYIIGNDIDGTGYVGNFGDFGIASSGYTSSTDGIVKILTLVSGGTGYDVDDVLTVVGGNSDCTITVLTVNGSGVILTWEITTNGTGYTAGVTELTTTGGSGSSATFKVFSTYDTSLFETNDVYLYGSGGNLLLGTDGGTTGKSIKFFTGGQATENLRMDIGDDLIQIGDLVFISSDTNKVSVGAELTNDPSAKFGVYTETIGEGITAKTFINHSSGFNFRNFKARGTISAPRRARSGDVLTGFNGFGYYAANDSTNATAPTSANAQFQFATTEAFTSTGQGTYFNMKLTPTGSTTLTEIWRVLPTGELKLGGTAVRGTTVGTNHIDIFDGTAPVGTLTNGFSTISQSGRGKVVDSLGYIADLNPMFGRSTSQTGAVASVVTYTPTADGSFLVSANVLVTTATTHNFTVTVAYTDEGNTARTLTLNFSSLAGVLATAIINTGGAVPYEGVPVHIRCKANTSITIATTGTFTSVNYNVEGIIRQVN